MCFLILLYQVDKESFCLIWNNKADKQDSLNDFTNSYEKI